MKGGIYFPLIIIRLEFFKDVEILCCKALIITLTYGKCIGHTIWVLIIKIQLMKSKILLLALSVMVTAQLMAQQSPEDSVKKVKQQQRIGEITKQINDRKEKLARLEIKLQQETKDKERATNEAQESADKNRQAAVKLSNDAEDRKKAKRAEKYSDDAKHDAKKARRASNNFEEIEKDIKVLKKRIAEDEKTLSDLNLEKVNSTIKD